MRGENNDHEKAGAEGQMWKMVFKNKELRTARGKNGENCEDDRETKH